MSRLRDVREHGEREREVELDVERQPFGNKPRAGEDGREPALAADVQYLLDRVASVKPSGLDVAGEEAGQPSPAAPEIDHSRVRESAPEWAWWRSRSFE